jgi:hypothetical protein
MRALVCHWDQSHTPPHGWLCDEPRDGSAVGHENSAGCYLAGSFRLDEHCRISTPESLVQVFDAEDGPDHRMDLHQEAPWPIIKDRVGEPLDLRIVPQKNSRSIDNCYLKDFSDGWIAVHHTKREIGFGLAWDSNVFQYMWIWQAFGGGIKYPWYGRTYCLGLEPWTSYPFSGLQIAIENRTACQLAPGASLDTWLTAVLFKNGSDVNYISRDGTVEWL